MILNPYSYWPLHKYSYIVSWSSLFTLPKIMHANNSQHTLSTCAKCLKWSFSVNTKKPFIYYYTLLWGWGGWGLDRKHLRPCYWFLTVWSNPGELDVRIKAFIQLLTCDWQLFFSCDFHNLGTSDGGFSSPKMHRLEKQRDSIRIYFTSSNNDQVADNILFRDLHCSLYLSIYIWRNQDIKSQLDFFRFIQWALVIANALFQQHKRRLTHGHR